MEQGQGDSPFRVGLGPMKPDEKDYLIRKGYLQEDSDGNLFGEPTTLIDVSTDEENEKSPKPEKNSDGQVLFHVGEVCVRSVRVRNSSMNSSVDTMEKEGLSNINETELEKCSPLKREETEGLEDLFQTPLKENLERSSRMEVSEIDENKENVNFERSEIEYSTPETSFCHITPPVTDCQTPPAMNPEAENELSFNDCESSPFPRNSRLGNNLTGLGSSQSGEELDDTISQMEKLLALADAQEREEELELELEMKRGETALTKVEDAPPVEFKTPFAPPPTPKKLNQIHKSPASQSPICALSRSGLKSRQPSPAVQAAITPKNLASTPKATSNRGVNSMVDSPISTICLSPTPNGKSKITGKVNKNFPSPVLTSTTPSALPVMKTRGKFTGINSPVAQYIYSTPTPPMVKRAIKTECSTAPQERRIWMGGKPMSAIPRPMTASGSSSGIPRLRSLRGSLSAGRLSESAYNQKSNTNLQDKGVALKFEGKKEIKPIMYQGSSQKNIQGREVKLDPRTPTPVSTPKVDVAQENFIAQRHTGMRTVDTNESIVQKASVDKRFIPTRVLIPPKRNPE